MNPVIGWLLDERTPAMRYRTMTEVLNEPETGEKVQAAYQATWQSREVQSMVARQNEQGVWEHIEAEYGVHTSLRYLTAAAEMGLKQDARLDKAVKYAVQFLLEKESADLKHDYSGCSNALVLRALVMLGYHQDAAVSELVQRYAATQLFDGGFMCRRLLAAKPNRKGCYKASVAALLLYAECRRSGIVLENSDQLVEYFLRRDVFYFSADKDRLLLEERPGWRSIDNFFPVETMRIGLPLIVAALCILGAGEEPSLKRAWELLESKQNADGRLVLEGTLSKQPVKFGKVGEENRWVTFYALLAKKYRTGISSQE